MHITINFGSFEHFTRLAILVIPKNYDPISFGKYNVCTITLLSWTTSLMFGSTSIGDMKTSRHSIMFYIVIWDLI